MTDERQIAALREEIRCVASRRRWIVGALAGVTVLAPVGLILDFTTPWGMWPSEAAAFLWVAATLTIAGVIFRQRSYLRRRMAALEEGQRNAVLAPLREEPSRMIRALASDLANVPEPYRPTEVSSAIPPGNSRSDLTPAEHPDGTRTIR